MPGFLVADRDKQVAAGVLAGGVAYRFFFWILAMSLLTNGALGFFDSHDIQSVLVAQGVDPTTRREHPGHARPPMRLAGGCCLVGAWLVLWTGYLGAKALMLVHAAVWGVPPPRVRGALLASVVFTGTALTFMASMSAVRVGA